MKKVISIRFHTDSKEDMELYGQLEREAGTTSSLAHTVKIRLKQAYEYQAGKNRDQVLQDKIVEAVREEMQQAGTKIIDSLLSMLRGIADTTVLSVMETESLLPEESEDLPISAFDFLE